MENLSQVYHTLMYITDKKYNIKIIYIMCNLWQFIVFTSKKLNININIKLHKTFLPCSFFTNKLKYNHCSLKTLLCCSS